MRGVLAKQFFEQEEQQTIYSSAEEVKSLYENSEVVYYLESSSAKPEQNEEIFKEAKKQFLKLLGELIVLNPLGLEKLSELKENVEKKLIVSSCRDDKEVILSALKKDLEELALNYVTAIKNCEAAEFQDLTVNVCLQGACSNTYKLIERLVIGGRDIRSYALQAKKEIIQEQARRFISDNNLLRVIEFYRTGRLLRQRIINLDGDEVHFVNILYNSVRERYKLEAIPDHSVVESVTEQHKVDFDWILLERLSLELLVRQLKLLIVEPSREFSSAALSEIETLLPKECSKEVSSIWPKALYQPIENVDKSIDYVASNLDRTFTLFLLVCLQESGLIADSFVTCSVSNWEVLYQTEDDLFVLTNIEDPVTMETRKIITCPDECDEERLYAYYDALENGPDSSLKHLSFCNFVRLIKRYGLTELILFSLLAKDKEPPEEICQLIKKERKNTVWLSSLISNTEQKPMDIVLTKRWARFYAALVEHTLFETPQLFNSLQRLEKEDWQHFISGLSYGAIQRLINTPEKIALLLMRTSQFYWGGLLKAFARVLPLYNVENIA